MDKSESNQCKCNCHVNGIKFILASNPPKPCCSCSEISNFIGYSSQVSPMVEQLQKLEKRINDLEESYKGMLHEIGELQDKNKEIDTHISKVHELVNIEDRITSGDVLNRVTFLEDRLKAIESKQSEFHFHRNCQIDENKKISRRVDEVEADNFKLNEFSKRENRDFANEISLRVKTLEDVNANSWDEINSRLEKIENCLQDKKDVTKIPHKCPVCFGRGFKEDQYLKRYDCDACKNEGIVWG